MSEILRLDVNDKKQKDVLLRYILFLCLLFCNDR